jgi:hypothetical protein
VGVSEDCLVCIAFVCVRVCVCVYCVRIAFVCVLCVLVRSFESRLIENEQSERRKSACDSL